MNANIAGPHALEDVVAKWVKTPTAWVDWVVWWWVEGWETQITFEAACEGPRGQSVGWYAAAEGDDGVRCLRGHEDWEEVDVLGIIVVDFMVKFCPKEVVAVECDAAACTFG